MPSEPSSPIASEPKKSERIFLLGIPGIMAVFSLAPFGLVLMWPKLRPYCDAAILVFWCTFLTVFFAALYCRNQKLFWTAWSALFIFAATNMGGCTRYLNKPREYKTLSVIEPNQALQHNDPSCHVSCFRTPRASRGRG